MRKKLTIALTAILVLGIASFALAKQVESGVIKLTSKKAGGPTKIDSTFKVADSTNTTSGQEGKPTKQITRVDIQFPKGMKFNYHVLPTCKESAYDAIVAKCKSAKLALGTTKIDGRGGPLGLVSAKLTAYNAVNGLKITVVSPKPTIGFPSVLAPSLKGTKLITQLPPALKVVNAYLTDFHLVIPIRSKKIKGKKAYYATLPKTCPKSKSFGTTVKYFLDGGGTFTTKPTKSPCTNPKKKKAKRKGSK